MKKDILFLCQFFYPEHNSSATLPFDTAKHLAGCGYTVDALCGYPKEYADATGIPLREQKGGVNIRRLRYWQLSRVGKLGRLINYFSFTLAVLLHISVLKNYRSVVVYSNPPILPLVPILANKLFHTKLIFVAYDVYPEVAYASSSLGKGGLIDRVMKRINRSLYKNASAVIALTEEMKQFILAHRQGIDEKNIFVIPNWAHEGKRQAVTADYIRFGYSEQQLIVSYFGNMGICQDVETMLDACKILKDRADIQFLIVGHGNKKAYVKEQTAALPNVKVLDFLTGDEFEQALAVSDCGIVSLERGLKGTCAPSKYYSYLQSGCAVLAVVENDSYLAKETVNSRIGYAVELGDGRSLADAIRSLADNAEACRVMQQNAALLYERDYAKPVAMRRYRDVIENLLKS